MSRLSETLYAHTTIEPNGCWLWTRGTNPSGYGAVKFRGRMDGAHRLSYARYNRVDIEDLRGWLVRHTCDQPRCINPHHLLLGTVADNARDREERSRNGRLRLSDEDVREIRRLRGQFLQRELAVRFGVSQTHVSKLLSGKSRAHVPEATEAAEVLP